MARVRGRRRGRVARLPVRPRREGWSFDILALSIALVAVLGVRISTDGGGGIARTRLLVVAAAALVPQAVGAMQLLRGEPTHTGLLTVATCVLFVLVVLRVSGLSRSVEKTAAMTEDLAADRARPASPHSFSTRRTSSRW
jgi:hypothetical protein